MVGHGGDQEMEGAKEVVVDASIVIKWFSKEKDSDLAIRIMDQHIDGRLVIVLLHVFTRRFEGYQL